MKILSSSNHLHNSKLVRFVVLIIVVVASIFSFLPHHQQVNALINLDPDRLFRGYYDPSDSAFGSLNLTGLSTPPTNIHDDPQLGYYFTSYEPLAKSTGFLGYAIALAPICVAVNASSMTSASEGIKIELSLETIGKWMMGTLAADEWNMTVTPPSKSYTGVAVGLGQLELI